MAGAAIKGATAAPSGLEASMTPLHVIRILRVVRSEMAFTDAPGKIPSNTPKNRRTTISMT